MCELRNSLQITNLATNSKVGFEQQIQEVFDKLRVGLLNFKDESFTQLKAQLFQPDDQKSQRLQNKHILDNKLL